MVLSYLIIIALTTVLISAYTVNSMAHYLITQKQNDVLTQANVLSGYISRYQDLSEETISYLLQQQQISASNRVIMVDADAVVTYDSIGEGSLVGKVILKKIVIDALSGDDAVQSEHLKDGELVISAAVPINFDKVVTGAIFFQASAESIMTYTSQMTRMIISIAVIIAILAAVLGVFLAGVITAPITGLTKTVVLMSKNDTEEKIVLNHSGEIGKLVDSFNQLIDKLRLQEQKRQEFVSNASHELKTPLSSIKLVADSLLQNPDASPEMEAEFLNDMNVQVDRLTRIIDKLLTLTKLDDSAAVSRMEFAVLDISELMKSVVRALKPLADKKNIRLTYESDIGIFSRIEKDRLWEAFYNILDNSIKYTKAGGSVEVALERDGNCAVISISDTGIGIASGEVYKIFDRFYRVDKARSRETGGTGLGLSIALSAIELHGGNIQVESKEGVGSRFKITIPITLK